MKLEKFSDIRFITWQGQPLVGLSEKITDEILSTLDFNTGTYFPAELLDVTRIPAQYLELGKNPGLGVRKIHAEGITGKNVTVAIIDQPLFLNHPEYEGKILSYWSPEIDERSSMHGPAVTSLLVGKNIGTAPDAKVHYTVARSWLGDQGEFVTALLKLIELNKTLPEGEKIKIVSLSASPTAKHFTVNSHQLDWHEAVKQAEKQGIIVLDCVPTRTKVFSGYFDINDPDNVDKFGCGYLKEKAEGMIRNLPGFLYVPAGNRTTAEQYSEKECGYVYWGAGGGKSWTTPYVAGILALGLQVQPDASPFDLYELLFETAYVKDGNKIINPPAFIERVKKLAFTGSAAR